MTYPQHVYDPIKGAEHIQGANIIAYSYAETITNRWRNPKKAFMVSCPSTDGYKTRAARLLGDGLKAYYSHRRGYVVSPTKFAKFEKLYAEGWDASPITGELWAPHA
jgi:hypothetical protein